jgi:hypothetical protein
MDARTAARCFSKNPANAVSCSRTSLRRNNFGFAFTCPSLRANARFDGDAAGGGSGATGGGGGFAMSSSGASVELINSFSADGPASGRFSFDRTSAGVMYPALIAV